MGYPFGDLHLSNIRRQNTYICYMFSCRGEKNNMYEATVTVTLCFSVM